MVKRLKIVYRFQTRFENVYCARETWAKIWILSTMPAGCRSVCDMSNWPTDWIDWLCLSLKLSINLDVSLSLKLGLRIYSIYTFFKARRSDVDRIILQQNVAWINNFGFSTRNGKHRSIRYYNQCAICKFNIFIYAWLVSGKNDMLSIKTHNWARLNKWFQG